MTKAPKPIPTWTKQLVLLLLESSDKALDRAVVKIYQNQTKDEQTAKATLKDNGKGFTGSDAHFYSKLAQEILAGKPLSPHVRAHIRHGRRFYKYAQQIADDLNAEIAKCEHWLNVTHPQLVRENEYADGPAFFNGQKVIAERKVEWTTKLQKLQPGPKLLEKVSSSA